MSFQMTLDDMQNAIRVSGTADDLRAVEELSSKFDALGDELAALIAARFKITAGKTNWDMGITACPFYPSFKGQQLPEELEDFDDGGQQEWDDDFDTAPELPEGFIEGEFGIMDVNPRDKVEILMPDGQRQTMMAVEAIRIPLYRAWRKL